MDQETFSFVYRASPIKRTKLVGLQRNACVALGNNGGDEAMEALHAARVSEHDQDVLEEINTSLSENGEKVSMY